jgi:dihydrofolate reductase
MRRIISAVYLTVDGVFEAPGGEPTFEHAGWSRPFFSEDVGVYKFEELHECDAQLLGRKTYDGFSAAWPAMGETDHPGMREFAQRMNGMPKYVASRTLTDPTWNATVLEGDAADAVRELKAGPGGDLLLAASADFSRTLMAHGLIDEYRLLVHPVVLGSGRRYFVDGCPKQTLELVGQRPFESGVILMTYRPVEAA